MKMWQIATGLVVAILLLAAAALWLYQAKGLYRFSPRAERPGDLGLTAMRVVEFTSEDGASINLWLQDPAPGRPLIVSFYGNYAGIGPSARRLLPLMEAGYGLAMMEYRGSGATKGPPGETRFAADARALYD
ncbi:MAG: alpha/beta hydrolase family protein, partial [Pikeienuella sp.]